METLTVSGMDFPDCFKVESHDVNKDSILTNRYDWYAPNVGRVKTVIEARSRVHETRLIKYRVR